MISGRPSINGCAKKIALLQNDADASEGKIFILRLDTFCDDLDTELLAKQNRMPNESLPGPTGPNVFDQREV